MSMADQDDATAAVVEGLKRLYHTKLKPLEQTYMFGWFHSPPLTDSEFESKPQVLMCGQYSTGKTSVSARFCPHIFSVYVRTAVPAPIRIPGMFLFLFLFSFFSSGVFTFFVALHFFSCVSFLFRLRFFFLFMKYVFFFFFPSSKHSSVEAFCRPSVW